MLLLLEAQVIDFVAVNHFIQTTGAIHQFSADTRYKTIIHTIRSIVCEASCHQVFCHLVFRSLGLYFLVFNKCNKRTNELTTLGLTGLIRRQ